MKFFFKTFIKTFKPKNFRMFEVKDFLKYKNFLLNFEVKKLENLRVE